MTTKDQIDKYQDFARTRLGFKFKDPGLLITALTHRSFTNEHPKATSDNERLEFLGDAILEFVVTDYLYKNYSKNEGVLTKWRAALVKTETNAESGFDLGLDELIRVSRGEKHAGKPAATAIIADAFEALIGAIYIDQGLPTTEKFITTIIKPKLEVVLEAGSWRDPKSFLQEISQHEVAETPRYKLISSEGPDHERTFTMAVFIGDKQMGAGTGSSKQTAETIAAEQAIEEYRRLGTVSGNRYIGTSKKK
ncbi:ribonuclease III [Candidatus Saccharibacteria bacterium]|nr:ribonuclease III [Candidatus Saccharibacteria bacterium]